MGTYSRLRERERERERERVMSKKKENREYADKKEHESYFSFK
jgi:hypothetical protein